MAGIENYEEESIRIGVFICHCGSNIGGVVDYKKLVDFVKTLPDVVYAEDILYACSESGLTSIKNAIIENNLNRFVMASCTIRTHQNLFQNVIRESNRNPYLLGIVNILEQCSWAHISEPKKAIVKAKDLISKSVSNIKFLEPIYETTVKINHSALIIGGGIAGLTTALSIARQGFHSYIIEREEELGGLVRKIYYVLGYGDPQEYLRNLINQVKNNKRIYTFTNAKIEEINGFIGNFSTLIKYNGKRKKIKSGVIIVATGGKEYKPKEYFYGKDERIITQLELEKKIAFDEVKEKTIVMIQCVGSRDENRTMCSQLCCAEAIKNALKLKEKNPKINIGILHRDIHTYGFKEDYYKEAREKGVFFIRFDEDFEPIIQIKTNKLMITFMDVALNGCVVLESDLIVLSAAFLPAENKELSKMLQVPLDKNGYFLEAHIKSRPLDFATDGIFLCGTAQWPKFIDETISQALGAAARACTILTRKSINTVNSIAEIDIEKCNGCGNCYNACAYNAIEIIAAEVDLSSRRVIDDQVVGLTWYKSKILPVLCKGCGICVEVCPSGALSIKYLNIKPILTTKNPV